MDAILFYFSGYPEDWTWNLGIAVKIFINFFIQNIRLAMKITSTKLGNIQRKNGSEYYTERH